MRHLVPYLSHVSHREDTVLFFAYQHQHQPTSPRPSSNIRLRLAAHSQCFHTQAAITHLQYRLKNHSNICGGLCNNLLKISAIGSVTIETDGSIFDASNRV